MDIERRIEKLTNGDVVFIEDHPIMRLEVLPDGESVEQSIQVSETDFRDAAEKVTAGTHAVEILADSPKGFTLRKKTKREMKEWPSTPPGAEKLIKRDS